MLTYVELAMAREEAEALLEAERQRVQALEARLRENGCRIRDSFDLFIIEDVRTCRDTV